MLTVHRDIRKVVQILLSAAAGGLFLMAMQVSARAGNQTFIIPANDGYGISECLAPGATCGKVVADAVCEAHGLAEALTFGSSDDITASIAAPAPRIQPGSMIVTCKE